MYQLAGLQRLNKGVCKLCMLFGPCNSWINTWLFLFPLLVGNSWVIIMIGKHYWNLVVLDARHSTQLASAPQNKKIIPWPIWVLNTQLNIYRADKPINHLTSEHNSMSQINASISHGLEIYWILWPSLLSNKGRLLFVLCCNFAKSCWQFCKITLTTLMSLSLWRKYVSHQHNMLVSGRVVAVQHEVDLKENPVWRRLHHSVISRWKRGVKKYGIYCRTRALGLTGSR